MKISTNRQKLMEYRKKVKTIKRQLKDDISRAEATLLLHTLIFHFEGFASQQQHVNEYMSVKYHWGNKRTARVLRTMAEIGVIDRSRSGPDKWTLFFLIRGFLDICRRRIERAVLAIGKRLNRYRCAIITIARMRYLAAET